MPVSTLVDSIQQMRQPIRAVGTLLGLVDISLLQFDQSAVSDGTLLMVMPAHQ